MMEKKFHSLFDLSNKVALVTGGLGVLGKRFCSGLAEFGAKVAVVDLDQEKSSEFAKVLAKDYGVETLGIGSDITDPDAVKDLVSSVENTLGPIEILHNNAASKGTSLENFFAPLEDYKLETWNEVMAANLGGYFLMAKCVGSKMAKRGKGSIIQTASIYGATMGPDQTIYEGSQYMGVKINTPLIYSVTKAGVVGLSNYLATYWVKENVRVNTLTPGGVQSGQNDSFVEKYSSRVPMERMAEADEMVSTLIFLASDASSYITGQNIHVDGGLSAW